ncbi:MAG: helix-turn-helix transcriptional regulator [Clostridia bacterium]|nr:helix-turn-helix transcriptional regulator [Clostridia bacterium]
MDALQRIKDLLNQYQWSAYKLCVKSGLPQSTLANMFARNNLPTLQTLEMICKGFGISLSQFFDYEEDGNTLQKQNDFLTKYNRLSDEQKRIVLDVMDNMK